MISVTIHPKSEVIQKLTVAIATSKELFEFLRVLDASDQVLEYRIIDRETPIANLRLAYGWDCFTKFSAGNILNGKPVDTTIILEAAQTGTELDENTKLPPALEVYSTSYHPRFLGGRAWFTYGIEDCYPRLDSEVDKTEIAKIGYKYKHRLGVRIFNKEFDITLFTIGKGTISVITNGEKAIY